MKSLRNTVFSAAVLSALMVLASCGTHLTVMTYNVGAFGKYMEDSTSDVADIIRSCGADIVALNELDSCNRRHPVHQAEKLAEELGGWDFRFGSAFPFAGGAYGNGVVSESEIIRFGRVLLPVSDGAEQRNFIVVETKDCVLAAVHLDHKGQRASLDQALFINKWFTDNYSECSKPVLLCGDMNSVPGSEVMTELEKSWDMLTETSPTYPSEYPEICIDYILRLKSSPKVRLISTEVVSTPATATASDHLPVCVRMIY